MTVLPFSEIKENHLSLCLLCVILCTFSGTKALVVSVIVVSPHTGISLKKVVSNISNKSHTSCSICMLTSNMTSWSSHFILNCKHNQDSVMVCQFVWTRVTAWSLNVPGFSVLHSGLICLLQLIVCLLYQTWRFLPVLFLPLTISQFPEDGCIQLCYDEKHPPPLVSCFIHQQTVFNELKCFENRM